MNRHSHIGPGGSAGGALTNLTALTDAASTLHRSKNPGGAFERTACFAARRLVSAGALLLFALAVMGNAMTRAGTDGKTVIRVGHFPNITHAQALIGHGLTRQGQGWFEKTLGPGVKVEWMVYHGGPTAMEAIFTGALDLAYVGPNPAINAHLRSRGKEIRIVAGACSGGAALVVRPDRAIGGAGGLRGRRIGTPQLGNTQDVAARAWLRSGGLRITLTGGDALVVPTSNPDQLSLFRKGDLDAVWTVEPWVSRLLLEAEGQLYLDEKTLWPETGGRYVTAHLVAGVRFLEGHPELLRQWIAAHFELTAWMNQNPDEAKRIFNDEFKAQTTRELRPEILDAAWKRLEFTHDPIPASLFQCAQAAHEIGFLRQKPELNRIYELRFLNEILRAKGLEAIPE